MDNPDLTVAAGCTYRRLFVNSWLLRT